MASVNIESEEAEKLQSQECMKVELENVNEMREEIDGDLEFERKLSAAGLNRTYRIFGGLAKDLKRKFPVYFSDFKDALAMKCFASVIFMYFASLVWILAFGALLALTTNNLIGIVESIASFCICGLLYSLLSGQPLTILNGSGSTLVFEAIAYSLCAQFEFDYLSFRLWIGIWTSVLFFILVASDCSVIVKYITRFTTDIYISLIALMLVYSKVGRLWETQNSWENKAHEDRCNAFSINDSQTFADETSFYDDNCTLPNYDSFAEQSSEQIPLISVLLLVFTFLIAFGLKQVHRLPRLPYKVGDLVSNFAAPIAFISMVSVDIFLGQSGIRQSTPKLSIPATFIPSWSGRDWFIRPFGYNPWWTCLMAIAPALLLTAIIFIEQHLTVAIVNQEENKLKKGGGYHLDTFVLSCLIFISSLFGLPWIIPNPILSINHVVSLKKFTVTSGKPQLLGVIEQRVTSLIVCVLIGLSVFFSYFLRMIPVCVMDGFALFLALSCLQNLKLVERVILIFLPTLKCRSKYFQHLSDLSLGRVHLFTFIQLSCILLFCLLKSFAPVTLIFPLMLLAVMGIRKGLRFIFSSGELRLLDRPLLIRIPNH